MNLSKILSLSASSIMLFGCLACNFAMPQKTPEEIPKNSIQASSSISTSVEYDYYVITGATASGLRGQMNQLGQVDSLGSRRDGLTI